MKSAHKDQIEAVQRMQDYINIHYKETVSLSDLAAVSHYSPWYSYRVFRYWLNQTPADYIRRLKLSRSALELRDEARRITDVAFDYGFQSVEGYQRAFCREFGMNPYEYSKHPVPIYLFTPFGVNYRTEKEIRMSEVKSVFLKEIEKPARKVIIKRGVKADDYWQYCAEVGCDVWGLLVSIKSIGSEPVCMWLPNRYRTEGTSEYVQGAEVPVEYDGEIPEGFELIELPAAKYLMFQSEPFEEKAYEEAIIQTREAIKNYNPAALGYCWNQENPRIQLEPIGVRGYIELLPVKEQPDK